MATDQQIEQDIQAKGANVAPRVKPADIERAIESEHYFSAADGIHGSHRDADGVIYRVPCETKLLTFCVLVLQNGFTVTGESACSSPENFNAEIGRKIARQNAVAKIWPLMGYELRSRIAAGATTIADRTPG